MNTTHNYFFKTNRSKNLRGNMSVNTNEENYRSRTSQSPKSMSIPKINKFKATTDNITVTNYNIQNLNLMDKDKLQEELIKSKTELNRKNKEFHTLKIANSKLDIDNKKNLKIIEDILEEACKNCGEQSDRNKSNINFMPNINISNNSLIKLREANLVNSLKSQIYEYKNQIISKDEELSALKFTTKVSRYHELDVKLKNTIEELNVLNENYNLIQQTLIDKEQKYKEALEEKEYYKAMMARVKSQFDENKEKCIYYQEQNSKLNDLKKNYEEKISNNRYKENSYKTLIREKDNIINTLKDQIKNFEVFKREKEKIENKLSNFNNILSTNKIENERKNKRLLELEKNNSEFKERIEILMTENKKLITERESTRTQMKNNTEKKKLNDENLKLKQEINILSEEIKFIKKGTDVSLSIGKKEFRQEDEHNMNNNQLTDDNKQISEEKNEIKEEKDSHNKIENNNLKQDFQYLENNNNENYIENNIDNPNDENLMENKFIPDEAHDENYDDNFENFIQSDQP